MNIIKTFLSNIAIGIFYIVMGLPVFIGIYHSVKKHSPGDVVASILLPPWGWYRGIEFFWHDDKEKASEDMPIQKLL